MYATVSLKVKFLVILKLIMYVRVLCKYVREICLLIIKCIFFWNYKFEDWRRKCCKRRNNWFF